MRKDLKSRKHLYLNLGEKKLNKELDIITMLRSTRELKILGSILMSKFQILMVKYQQANLLHTSTSESEIQDNLNVVELNEHPNQQIKSM